MAMLKGMQFAVCRVVVVVREKIAPGAIQFHPLRIRHRGLYTDHAHMETAKEHKLGPLFKRTRTRNAYAHMETGL